jgi:hypothetical protein
MEHDNHESWLNRVAVGMAPLFEALDAPLPSRVRVAIGFTSRGAKGKAIRECWDNRRSGDGHFEIFIRPDLAHAPTRCRRSLRSSRTSWSTRRSGSRPDTGERSNGPQPGWGWSGQCAPPPLRTPSFPPLQRSSLWLVPMPPARLDTGSAYAEMPVRDVRLYRQDRAQMAGGKAGASLCPVEGHGPMRHGPIGDGAEDESVKRLRHFTTKRISSISRLAA